MEWDLLFSFGSFVETVVALKAIEFLHQPGEKKSNFLC